MWLNDLLAALGVVINGIPAILLAMTYGFFSFSNSLRLFGWNGGLFSFK